MINYTFSKINKLSVLTVCLNITLTDSVWSYTWTWYARTTLFRQQFIKTYRTGRFPCYASTQGIENEK